MKPTTLKDEHFKICMFIFIFTVHIIQRQLQPLPLSAGCLAFSPIPSKKVVALYPTFFTMDISVLKSNSSRFHVSPGRIA